MKKKNLSLLTPSHFKEIQKNGYSLDIIYLLLLVEQEVDIKDVCKESPKLEALYQGIYRKGLITENNTLTMSGKTVLEFYSNVEEEKPLKKKQKTDTEFDLWWKAYPGTDTFKYRNQSFSGTRSLRAKKDDCKLKLDKILEEGDYTIQDLIGALEYEVLQKKENSIKTKTNKLSYMQNSLTYLNQRTFEPFIELIKEGNKIVEAPQTVGGTDI